MADNTPTMTCPQCGGEECDSDGFGMIAHVRPVFANGCGWCSHPSRDRIDGVWVCGICGDTGAP